MAAALYACSCHLLLCVPWLGLHAQTDKRQGPWPAQGPWPLDERVWPTEPLDILDFQVRARGAIFHPHACHRRRRAAPASVKLAPRSESVPKYCSKYVLCQGVCVHANCS